KDIEAALGSQAYPRLRFGIGSDFSKGRQVEFVLGKWTEEEWPVVQKKIDASVGLIEDFVLQGIDAAMNHFNTLKFT
ncbi:MAG TPA: aminoacyl-tRNA hydrolase, partial [Phnomibacter sp.]|nr:aminoacyl-tRNA hydrolase [Phnomibacter sp.]